MSMDAEASDASKQLLQLHSFNSKQQVQVTWLQPVPKTCFASDFLQDQDTVTRLQHLPVLSSRY